MNRFFVLAVICFISINLQAIRQRNLSSKQQDSSELRSQSLHSDAATQVRRGPSVRQMLKDGGKIVVSGLRRAPEVGYNQQKYPMPPVPSGLEGDEVLVVACCICLYTLLIGY